MDKYIIFSMIALTILISACSSVNPPLNNTNGSTSGSNSCSSIGGTYSPEYKECLGISKEQCESMNGTFNECASACRHDPNAQVCTLQCVIVCNLN